MSRIVVTGAAGRLGSVLGTGLAIGGRELVLTDREPAPPGIAAEYHRLDLTDFDATLRLMQGADAVVHLAGIPDEAEFERLLDANVIATRNVYEAAHRAGVDHIVYASSAHVTGMYTADETVGPESPPAPDTTYAVTKLFGENLASLYAAKHGLPSTCVRIGSFRPEPENARQLATWLSPRDAVQLFSRCLDSVPDGVRILYGVSANHRSWWSDAPGRSIGFIAVDDAEAYAERYPSESAGYQGGPFADPAYEGGAG